MRKMVALFLAFVWTSFPVYAVDEKGPCPESMRSFSELELKLISHVRRWVKQFSGFKVESVTVQDLEVTIRGIQTDTTRDIRQELRKTFKYRKGVYRLKIEIGQSPD